jgi:hypothetical protein
VLTFRRLRHAGAVAAACARYLITVDEASSFQIRDALDGRWDTRELNAAMRLYPELFERLPNKPGLDRAWWRLREVER